MYRYMWFLGLLLISSKLYAKEVRVDMGVALAPTIVPEVGYSEARLRTGIEIGLSLWNLTSEGLIKENDPEIKQKPTLKLFRLGISYIDNSYGLVITPLAVNLKDKLYFAPSFTFGAKPYQTISISYELW